MSNRRLYVTVTFILLLDLSSFLSLQGDMLSRALRALSSGQSARGRSHSQYRGGNSLSMRIDDLKLSCQNSCSIFWLRTKLAFPSLCGLCVLCTGRAFFVALSFTSSVWIHIAKSLLVGLLKPFRLERCWVFSLHVCHSTTCAGSLFSDIPLTVWILFGLRNLEMYTWTTENHMYEIFVSFMYPALDFEAHQD